MHDATLCIPIKQDRLILGYKKRGFGQGKYNGFGGKVRPDETIEQAAVRELYEELGIEAINLRKVAELEFHFPYAQEKNWDQLVHVFLVKDWKNAPRESEEMGYKIISTKNIPYNEMWDDDKHWLPLVLSGKSIKGKFSFQQDNKTVNIERLVHEGITFS